MNLRNPQAEIFVPDGTDSPIALDRTTHMGIGSHQDDLEILAMHGVLAGLKSNKVWFTGVTCTDGAGSPRTGQFADFTDEQMKETRWEEQRQAALTGNYGAMVQLKYPSSAAKDLNNDSLDSDLDTLLRAATPSVIYTHNLADKHDTHVAVAARTIKAIRRLPVDKRPSQVYGVEVWRGLDWMPDDRKVILDVSDGQDIAMKLIGVYQSQIAGGKRYDLATLGRWQANATFFESHGTDAMTLAAYAMDLMPLVRDPSLDIAAFVINSIDAFKSDVSQKLTKNFC